MSLTIPDFSRARVLVVGDLMLDRYWQGGTSRISPEAPVPVVRVDEVVDRPGGAGNVAVNIATLGAVVTVDGLVGDDDAGALLTDALHRANVACRHAALPDRSTITKLRVLSRHQQLIRLDFETPWASEGQAQLIERFDAAVDAADVVVLSDYDKGTLQGAAALIESARACGTPVLVDPKGNDFSRYRGATVLTPNMAELQAVVGPCPDEATLLAKGEALRNTLQLEALLITRSEKGMTLIAADCPPAHFPTQAREVFDVTGAGDTVISVLATGLAAGLALPDATALANLAAGIVVGKLGAAPVSVDELRRENVLQHAQHGDFATGVVSEAQLLEAVSRSKALGERIVMTNGCFDILHAGHVAYLQQALELGDRLVVAVNDDASVRALKGPQRPVVPLAQRMAVLAGLAAVDWVVPFSEETPQRLICRVLPDVLVKGGDYQPHEIAGADCVTGHGGEVKVLAFVKGCSTSQIIRTVRQAGPST